ncbi:MAG: 3'(2'),5'-bisphosphate nucleotidase [Acidobacteria bacterium]|nr:3'(2'),5'-bisphosphate nucleotidase [Acidobacteriota bacterium]
MSEYGRERRVAIDAVRKASLVCRAVQQRLSGLVLTKQDLSPVTVADFASQALICRALQEAFPADAVVAEESADALREPANRALLDEVVRRIADVRPGAAAADVLAWLDHGAGAPASRFWTLDPIDGTKGFVRRDQYAVALALLVDNDVVVAAAGCPNLPLDPADPGRGVGAIVAAVRGGGADIRPLDGGGSAQPLRVSGTAQPADAQLCESVEGRHSSHGRTARVAGTAGITREPLRLDSLAKYVVVARGEADAYLRFSRGDYRENIWDHAAGYLICAEAGGRATDLDGRPLDFTTGRRLENNRGVIASNGRLHERLVDAVRQASG